MMENKLEGNFQRDYIDFAATNGEIHVKLFMGFNVGFEVSMIFLPSLMAFAKFLFKNQQNHCNVQKNCSAMFALSQIETKLHFFFFLAWH